MKYYLRPVLQATNTLVAKISEITSCKESSHKLRKFFRELLTLVLLLEHRYLIVCFSMHEVGLVIRLVSDTVHHFIRAEQLFN